MEITLAKRLKARALQIGMKPNEIAEQAGVNRSFIYDVLAGRSLTPCAAKLTSIAKTLKCDREWLQFGVGEFEGDEPADHHYAENSVEASSPPPGYIAVPMLNVRPSMGHGTVINDDEVQSQPVYFYKGWLKSSLNISPRTVRMMPVIGDSMEPTLYDQDLILVDTSDQSVFPPGLYVLNDGCGVVAKRLQPVPNSEPLKVRVISDNKHYSAYERLAEEVNIIGRIKWFARGVI